MIRLMDSSAGKSSFNLEDEKKKAREQVYHQLVTFTVIVSAIRIAPFVIERLF